ncbi:Uncharacterised protein [Vibrio cholerae]|nr:Uncharacterised protein [Vibrio cholerae]
MYRRIGWCARLARNKVSLKSTCHDAAKVASYSAGLFPAHHARLMKT